MLVRNAKKKAAALAAVAALLFIPITVNPLDSAAAAGESPIRVAEACAQGVGCAWWPEQEPPCPNKPPHYYWNFGDCDPQ